MGDDVVEHPGRLVDVGDALLPQVDVPQPERRGRRLTSGDLTCGQVDSNECRTRLVAAMGIRLPPPAQPSSSTRQFSRKEVTFRTASQHGEPVRMGLRKCLADVRPVGRTRSTAARPLGNVLSGDWGELGNHWSGSRVPAVPGAGVSPILDRDSLNAGTRSPRSCRRCRSWVQTRRGGSRSTQVLEDDGVCPQLPCGLEDLSHHLCPQRSRLRWRIDDAISRYGRAGADSSTSTYSVGGKTGLSAIRVTTGAGGEQAVSRTRASMPAVRCKDMGSLRSVRTEKCELYRDRSGRRRDRYSGSTRP